MVESWIHVLFRMNILKIFINRFLSMQISLLFDEYVLKYDWQFCIYWFQYKNKTKNKKKLISVSIMHSGLRVEICQFWVVRMRQTCYNSINKNWFLRQQTKLLSSRKMWPSIKILFSALECDKLINFVKVWKVFVQFEAVIHGTASKEWV